MSASMITFTSADTYNKQIDASNNVVDHWRNKAVRTLFNVVCRVLTMQKHITFSINVTPLILSINVVSLCVVSL